MVEPENDTREPTEEIETTQYPWYIRELKKLQMGNRFKMLLLLGLGVFILHLFFQWFDWFFLLGLIPAPAWYVWAVKQIDKESYTILEFKLKGDIVHGKKVNETQLNIYHVPPDVWRTIEKKGTPYLFENRVYVCELFENDDEKMIIHFSDDPRLSNLTFFGCKSLWLDYCATLPRLEEELAIAKYNLEIEATRRAVIMVSKMNFIDENLLKPVVTKRYLKEVKTSEKMP